MKITANQYAKSLYVATENKSQNEIDVAVGNFVKILAKSNQLKFKKKIIQKFEEIYGAENGLVRAEIVSREKLSNLMTARLNNFIKNKYQAKEVIIENKIDEKIGGGMIIQVGDEVMDASIARQLANLNRQLVK